mmetsp:Transcript_2838/g.6955  ORF Transcript_2838/g.6955 Transcript_2838/m.6955 type:complete len:211 (-) Transcript_2838:73-705(-)
MQWCPSLTLFFRVDIRPLCKKLPQALHLPFMSRPVQWRDFVLALGVETRPLCKKLPHALHVPIDSRPMQWRGFVLSVFRLNIRPVRKHLPHPLKIAGSRSFEQLRRCNLAGVPDPLRHARDQTGPREPHHPSLKLMLLLAQRACNPIHAPSPLFRHFAQAFEAEVVGARKCAGIPVGIHADAAVEILLNLLLIKGDAVGAHDSPWLSVEG